MQVLPKLFMLEQEWGTVVQTEVEGKQVGDLYTTRVRNNSKLKVSSRAKAEE